MIPAQRTVEEIKVALTEVRELRAKTDRDSVDRATLDWALDRLLEELKEAHSA